RCHEKERDLSGISQEANEAWNMKPLDKDTLAALRKERQSIGYGQTLTQARLDALQDQWLDCAQPDQKHSPEDFAITKQNGDTTGVYGPRWLFHLFGLAH